MTIETFQEPIQARHALLSFSGWSDVGKLIQRTISELKQAFHMKRVAAWDMEGFWHTESSRPKIMIQHGRIQHMAWPVYNFFLATPVQGEPFLVGTGPEPGCHWRTFCHQLLHLLQDWGCEEVYTLGSLSDQVFHDEVVVSGIALDARGLNHIHELGCQLIEYTGPSAVHGAIMEAARDLDIYTLSLWAHMPFYLKDPHELLLAYLLRLLGKLLGVELRTRHLHEAWKVHEKEIESHIQQDPELRRMLETMENEVSLGAETSERKTKVIRLDEFLKKRHTTEPGGGEN